MFISWLALCCPLADLVSYGSVQGPASERLMWFDWGQNLGRCFGGILNVSVQAWRCVFWSKRLIYSRLLQLLAGRSWLKIPADVTQRNMQHVHVIVTCKYRIHTDVLASAAAAGPQECWFEETLTPSKLVCWPSLNLNWEKFTSLCKLSEYF